MNKIIPSQLHLKEIESIDTTLSMKFFLCLLVLPSLLFGQDALFIHVRTEGELVPLHLTSLEVNNCPFSQTYRIKLEKILQFDLTHNGKSYLQNEKERSYGAIQWNIEGKKLLVVCHIHHNQQTKSIEVELIGDLTKDRQKIHQISDALSFILFGQKGIATSRILYTVRKRSSQKSDTWKTEVFQCDYDGANPQQITFDGCLAVTPSYIPPKKGRSGSFLFVSYAIGQPKLFAGSLRSKEKTRLSYLPGNQLTPAISPQGDYIAFISDATGNPELFLQNFDRAKGIVGKPRLIFASLAGAQGCPAFSPDGQQIAFVSNKDGRPRIYLMTIPQKGLGKALMITKKALANTSPAWSPDGTKLAYSGTYQGIRQIWIYDFQTQEEWRLTSGTQHKENPSWASNSLHLVYNTCTDDESELYLIDLNRREPQKISFGPGEKQFPSIERLSS
ncbi:MAG: Tol-Pal system protein TolB [Chlamydiia bacterium]|nr:Tol-Pal system protein TolB [Chlamydiia bacterium]